MYKIIINGMPLTEYSLKERTLYYGGNLSIEKVQSIINKNWNNIIKENPYMELTQTEKNIAIKEFNRTQMFPDEDTAISHHQYWKDMETDNKRFSILKNTLKEKYGFINQPESVVIKLKSHN